MLVITEKRILDVIIRCNNDGWTVENEQEFINEFIRDNLIMTNILLCAFNLFQFSMMLDGEYMIVLPILMVGTLAYTLFGTYKGYRETRQIFANRRAALQSN